MEREIKDFLKDLAIDSFTSKEIEFTPGDALRLENVLEHCGYFTSCNWYGENVYTVYIDLDCMKFGSIANVNLEYVSSLPALSLCVGIHLSNGMYGGMCTIDFSDIDDDALFELDCICSRLDNYPILDDDAYYKLEAAAIGEETNDLYNRLKNYYRTVNGLKEIIRNWLYENSSFDEWLDYSENDLRTYLLSVA